MGDVETTNTLTESFRQHERAVFTYFRRLGVPPEEAADLAQTTFLRALRGIERFRGESTVTTWLIGIARNVFREWVRRRHRGDTGLEGVDSAAPDGSANVDVLDVLARLDVEAREVLVLRHILDLPTKEIAVVLGISDAAVRQRISRAGAAFKETWSTS
jgi:RNA polymerase sigma-70 factor (ECF subfamily)